MRTTACSKILDDFTPTYESTVGANLWNAGAVMLGKLNCDEFAILNAVAEVDGDAGQGRVYICELRCSAAGEWSQAYGLYQDRYRRRDGAWRIASRRYSSLARLGERIESFRLPEIEP